MPWIHIADPDGTYCCHLSPKELREATREYLAREAGRQPRYSGLDEPKRGSFVHYRTIDGEEVELISTPAPAIYPSQIAFESDEERTTLDTDDDWIVIAARRYDALMKRAAMAKRRLRDARLDETLARLRGEWKDVETETGVKYEETQAVPVFQGRDGEARLKRERASVAYIHRDPSDWQIASLTPEPVRDRLEVVKAAAAEGGWDLNVEETRRTIQIRYRRSQVRELWKRLFAELGEDAMRGRIITAWLVEIDGVQLADYELTPKQRRMRKRYVKPLRTVGFEQFVERHIRDAGGELEGLEKALQSLRFRIVKKRERAARKSAA